MLDLDTGSAGYLIAGILTNAGGEDKPGDVVDSDLEKVILNLQQLSEILGELIELSGILTELGLIALAMGILMKNGYIALAGLLLTAIGVLGLVGGVAYVKEIVDETIQQRLPPE
ncbi:MAG: hypothetical protein HZA23_06115 [Nitrospirae bacterium]|nr:hypothetical protein [Nitrospirota bacterium]